MSSAKAADFRSTHLASDAAAIIAAGSTVERHTYEDEDGDVNAALEVLWVPEDQRAAVVANGNPLWTDADSPEHAAELFRAGRMVP